LLSISTNYNHSKQKSIGGENVPEEAEEEGFSEDEEIEQEQKTFMNTEKIFIEEFDMLEESNEKESKSKTIPKEKTEKEDKLVFGYNVD